MAIELELRKLEAASGYPGTMGKLKQPGEEFEGGAEGLDEFWEDWSWTMAVAARSNTPQLCKFDTLVACRAAGI